MAQLIDAFNRKITYIRISVTDRCNLRCVYCVPSCGTISSMPSKDLMSFDEMLRIIKVAAKMGLTKVRITGGEPLVRRGVVDFIAAVNKVDGIKDIAMTTNGVLLKQYAQSLKKAGLRRLNISLDTFDPKKFMEITKGDCFDTCNRIRLGADGKIKHCLFSESYIDFREPIRNGCDDSEIEKLLSSVMETKPEAHNIDMNAESQKFLHSMTQIGG